MGGGSQIGSVRFENDARKGHRSFEDGRQGAFFESHYPTDAEIEAIEGKEVFGFFGTSSKTVEDATREFVFKGQQHLEQFVMG